MSSVLKYDTHYHNLQKASSDAASIMGSIKGQINSCHFEIRNIENTILEIDVLLSKSPLERTENHYISLVAEKASVIDEKSLDDLVEKLREMEGYKDTTLLADECTRAALEIKKRIAQETQQKLNDERIVNEHQKDKMMSAINQFNNILSKKKKEREKITAQLEAENKQKTEHYSVAVKERQEEIDWWQSQSDSWREQGLCPHCGEKTGLFGIRCKVCKIFTSTPVEIYVPEISPPALIQNSDVNIYIQIPKIIINFGGLEWRILDIEKGKALLLSEKIIEYSKPYHDRHEFITWETCNLRAYLNGEFCNQFVSKLKYWEKAMLIKSRNKNKDNPWHDSRGGNDTSDWIFLLSIDEAIKYFGDNNSMYNKNRIAGFGTNENRNDWWLRSIGERNGGGSVGWIASAAYVCTDGAISGSGRRVELYNVQGCGIRPALWLNFEA